MGHQPISRYIDRDLETMIVRALRAYVSEFDGAAPDAEIEMARDYADALENDTYLLETTTPPDEVSTNITGFSVGDRVKYTGRLIPHLRGALGQVDQIDSDAMVAVLFDGHGRVPIHCYPASLTKVEPLTEVEQLPGGGVIA